MSGAFPIRLLLAAFCLMLLPARLSAQAEADGGSLIGLWASETVYPARLAGDLTVRRRAGQWLGSIAGSQSTGKAIGRDVRLSFGSGGSFRGRVAPGGRRIEGFWLRPSGETEDRADPGGSGQPFATPLILRKGGTNLWRGTVVPLDDRFTLYLKVFRDTDGSLVAAFRNPEMNANGGASRFNVERRGANLRFAVRYDGGEIVHEATLLRSPDRIRIPWRGVDRPLELTRRSPAQAAAFFPRPPGERAYSYRRPPETGDGWRTERASGVGFDEPALARIVQDIAGSDPAARPPRLIHSILVARRGRLVLEEYFFGYGRDTPHDIRSAGKTFSSVLLGAAMMKGVRIGPDSRIVDLMRSRGPFANPDPRKDRITLAHLMTHSAGLACNDYDEASPGNEGTMSRQDAQPDWWKYTLDLPMAHEPGSRYAYCSANTNLVGGGLSEATGTWLPELFDKAVARPLQFGRYHWNLAANGEGYLGGGAFIRPRDLLKLGQAYLAGGVWNGRRIVSPDWVVRSTRPMIAITPATTGLTAEEFGNSYGGGEDALAWHLNPLTSGGKAYRSYEANGNGGQILLVVPELDLAVVFTGGNYLQGGVWGRWRQEIVGDRIIPAILH